MERYKLCVGARGPGSLVTSAGTATRLHDVMEYTTLHNVMEYTVTLNYLQTMEAEETVLSCGGLCQGKAVRLV